jgi:hypothetical protein
MGCIAQFEYEYIIMSESIHSLSGIFIFIKQYCCFSLSEICKENDTSVVNEQDRIFRSGKNDLWDTFIGKGRLRKGSGYISLWRTSTDGRSIVIGRKFSLDNNFI